MIKFKKVFVLIAGVIGLTAFSCCASADAVIDERGNAQIDVTYDMSDFGYWTRSGDDYTFIQYDNPQKTYVGIICLASSEEIYDLTELTMEEINEKAVYIGSTSVDEYGLAEASFRLPAKSGKYTVAFVNKELGIQLVSFEYESKICFEYNDTLAEGKNAILNFIEENKDVIPLNKIGYNMLNDTQKESLADILLENGEKSNLEDFNETIASLPVEKIIFEQFEASDVLLYIQKCNENEYSFFDTQITDVFLNELSEDEKLAIVSDFVGSEFTEEKQAEFEFETLKAYIESFEYFTDIENVIKSTDNIWGFSEEALEDYDDIENKNDVMSEMIEKIETVTSIEEYRECFDEIVEEQLEDEEDSSGSSSGGGSKRSSGGGGGFSVKADKTVENIVIPENTAPPVSTPVTAYDDMQGYDWAKEAVDALTKAGIVNGVAENSFAPAQTVKREEFVKMIAGALKLTGIEAEAEFDDVDKNAWYYPSVCALVRENIVNGISLTQFGIGNNITREDMAVILDRVYDLKNLTLEKKLTPAFTDEETISDYALDSVGRLAGIEIIGGYDDGTFKPKNSLTRAEAAVVIHRFFDKADLLN